ncbi:MAG: hypothetical protein KatS3mg045_1909 [Bellilinea sp.]|nr:MAG: hypothetical protein KatS3mg045_1909 [Bellilinea sp.]
MFPGKFGTFGFCVFDVVRFIYDQEIALAGHDVFKSFVVRNQQVGLCCGFLVDIDRQFLNKPALCLPCPVEFKRGRAYDHNAFEAQRIGYAQGLYGFTQAHFIAYDYAFLLV